MLRNSENHYGLITIIIHWLMAAAIFGMFGLGLYMVELTYYDSWYKGSIELHKSIGLTIFFIYVIRVTWRLSNATPKVLNGAQWEQRAAHVMHLSLYGAIGLLMVSGYLISTADGRAIEVFELFSVPATITSIENQEDIAGEVHEILAWLLVSMAALHAGAALKHHFIDKDGTLIRMLKSQ